MSKIIEVLHSKLILQQGNIEYPYTTVTGVNYSLG